MYRDNGCRIKRTVNLVRCSTKKLGLIHDIRLNEMMMQWFNEHGYEAIIPALRALYPSLLNVEAWLRKNGWQA